MADSIKKESNWLLKEKYGGVHGPVFLRDVERLKKGEPVDYVIGFREFLDCKIDLSKKAFIPEAETEYWAEQAIGEIQKDGRASMRCLDMFAGSGCVGIAALRHIPSARVDFAEKYKKFCLQIAINLKLNGMSGGRWRVFQSNIFSAVRDSYDYIFANPPYVAPSRAHLVQKSVVRWEPKQALFAEKNGLALIETFLLRAKGHLNPGGRMYMEFDSWQKPAIERMVRRFGYGAYEFRKDQYKTWRYIVIAP